MPTDKQKARFYRNTLETMYVDCQNYFKKPWSGKSSTGEGFINGMIRTLQLALPVKTHPQPTNMRFIHVRDDDEYYTGGLCIGYVLNPDGKSAEYSVFFSKNTYNKRIARNACRARFLKGKKMEVTGLKDIPLKNFVDPIRYAAEEFAIRRYIKE